MPFPVSQARIEEAEAQLGRRLPDAQRQRLLRANGGEVEAVDEDWTLYPVWDPTDRKTMGRTANHIVRENEAWRRDWPDMLPGGFLAIGDNGEGDLLVIGPDRDDILLWNHETRELTPVTVNWADRQ